GSVNITKAINIAEQFEISKQFWTYLVEKEILKQPKEFIRRVPHMSAVFGEKDVAFLRTRHQTMVKENLFKDMVFTEEREVLKDWLPLMMDNRPEDEVVAATRMDIGTDVNFGTLTRDLIKHLQTKNNIKLSLNQEVRDIERESDGLWEVEVKDV